MKNIPLRTCMGCNEKKPKKELVRIVKNKDGEIFIDRTGKADGRGAYICDSLECLEKVIKSKRLEKVLEIQIPEEVYNRHNFNKIRITYKSAVKNGEKIIAKSYSNDNAHTVCIYGEDNNLKTLINFIES